MLQVSSHLLKCLYTKGLGNFIPCSCSHSISQAQSKQIIYSFTAIPFGQFIAYCFHLYTLLFAERNCIASLCPQQPSDSHRPRWAACTDSCCLIKFSYWQDFSGRYLHWRLPTPMAYNSNTDSYNCLKCWWHIRTLQNWILTWNSNIAAWK